MIGNSFGQTAAHVYTVSEFVDGMNQLLRGIPAVVQGEISNFRIAQNRFVWFDLKDDSSVVNCFMLVFQLDQELEDGMEVHVYGNPGLFKKSGKFHIKVQKIQLVGAGSLKRQYELLKAKLQKEGLFDEERKRKLPMFPRRIGLVTSADAAAYTDVVRILRDRWSGLEIMHFSVQVQGTAAPRSVVKALQFINNEYADDLDVVIVTRGGGSLEDLQAFNDEAVVRAIFALRVPSVVGIGHERDETLAELAADVRAATPTNAAELVVPHRDDVAYQLRSMLTQQESQLRHVMRDYQQRIRDSIDVLDDQVGQYAASMTALRQRYMLSANQWQHQLVTQRARVSHLRQLLESLNPAHVLRRGYSITRDARGRVITQVAQAQSGSRIVSLVSNGEIKSQVL